MKNEKILSIKEQGKTYSFNCTVWISSETLKRKIENSILQCFPGGIMIQHLGKVFAHDVVNFEFTIRPDNASIHCSFIFVVDSITKTFQLFFF